MLKNNSAFKIYNSKLVMDGDVMSTYADVSDLMRDFNYKPDTSLEVGIERFVGWHREFYCFENIGKILNN